MRLFPEQFERLFTYVSPDELMPEYFLELLRIPVNMSEEEKRTADMLKEFIHSSSSGGIYYVTIHEQIRHNALEPLDLSN